MAGTTKESEKDQANAASAVGLSIRTNDDPIKTSTTLGCVMGHGGLEKSKEEEIDVEAGEVNASSAGSTSEAASTISEHTKEDSAPEAVEAASNDDKHTPEGGDPPPLKEMNSNEGKDPRDENEAPDWEAQDWADFGLLDPKSNPKEAKDPSAWVDFDLLEQESSNSGRSESDAESGPETPCCFICLERLPMELFQADVITGTGKAVCVEPCNHTFCSACLKKVIHADVKAKLVPSVCPMYDCSVLLQTHLIHTILSQDDNNKDKQLLRRYEQLKKLHNNPSLVECIQCQEVFSPASTEEVALSCSHCGHNFCREHGDAHPGGSCEEWSKTEDGRRALRTEKRMRRLTRPCPHCKIPIQKVDGCDHVYCTNCNKDMCWSCGGGYDASREKHSCPPTLLRPFWNLLPENVRESMGCCWEFTLTLVSLIALSLIWMLVGVVGALATGFFACGWCCWKTSPQSPRRGDWEDWGDWTPSQGCRLACVLTFYPFALCCFGDGVEDQFPGLLDTVGTFISDIAGGFRACFAYCFCCGEITDFPVMPVTEQGANNKTSNKKEEEKGKTESMSNDTVAVTKSSEAEVTV